MIFSTHRLINNSRAIKFFLLGLIIFIFFSKIYGSKTYLLFQMTVTVLK